MVHIYTDGACLQNPGPGGWAFYIPDRDIRNWGSCIDTTNNVMEMTAIMEAINWCIDNDEKATIYSDSRYCVKGFNQWMHSWAKSSWDKPRKNREMWQQMFNLYPYFNGKLIWCRGHSGIFGNEEADMLAENAAWCQ